MVNSIVYNPDNQLLFTTTLFRDFQHCAYTCEMLLDSSEPAVLSSMLGVEEPVFDTHLSLQSLSITEKRAGSLKSWNIYLLSTLSTKKLLVKFLVHFYFYAFNWHTFTGKKNVTVQFQNNPFMNTYTRNKFPNHLPVSGSPTLDGDSPKHINQPLPSL